MTDEHRLEPTRREGHFSRVILAYPTGRPGNPYTELLYCALARRGWRVDDLSFEPRALLRSRLPAVLHVHWPEQVAATTNCAKAFARLLLYAVVLTRCRIGRRPVVWTVHNLHAHDSRYPRVARVAVALTRWAANGVVFMSGTAERQFRDRYVRAPASITVRHGDLSSGYGPVPDKAAARSRLGIEAEAFLILAFGRLRAYKNLGQLLGAFHSIEDEHWRLLVAGKADEGATRTLERMAEIDKRVLLQLGFRSSEELGTAIAASDLVCIPFSDVLHSGSSHLAASMGRTVLVPDIGSLAELRSEFTKGKVVVYSPPLTSARLAAAVAESGCARDRGGLNESQDWMDIAAAHEDFFADLAGAR